jgi:hypothetical protein
VTEGSEGADDYIRGFVKICEDAGVQVCFMRVPYPASVENQRAENRVLKLAEELGIEVIDMMYVVDWDTDLVDPNAHLNAYGAYKVSNFLGGWLKRCYGFSDKREDSDYANWKEDFSNVYLPALNIDLKLYTPDLSNQTRSTICICQLNFSDDSIFLRRVDHFTHKSFLSAVIY